MSENDKWSLVLGVLIITFTAIAATEAIIHQHWWMVSFMIPLGMLGFYIHFVHTLLKNKKEPGRK